MARHRHHRRKRRHSWTGILRRFSRFLKWSVKKPTRRFG